MHHYPTHADHHCMCANTLVLTHTLITTCPPTPPLCLPPGVGVVVTMLPTTEHVRDAYEGVSHGLSLLIDHLGWVA